jgi:hypothetical protein
MSFAGEPYLIAAGRSEGTAEEMAVASMGQVLLAVEKIAPTHPHPRLAGSLSLLWASARSSRCSA